jgi:predicted nuclease of predicted toxin-antitoxin system
VILFFDDSIPRRIVEALRALGCEARHLSEELSRSASDEEMLAFLGKHRDWRLVTQASRMAQRPHERAALMQAGIGVFVFATRAPTTVEQLMILVLECLPQMRARAERLEGPFMIAMSEGRRHKRME